MCAQYFVGTWKGDLEVMGQKLPLVFHIQKDNLGYSSTIDSPLQGAMGIVVDKTELANDEIVLTQNAMNAQFKGKIVQGALSGNFVQNGFSIPLTMQKSSESNVLNRPQTPKPPFAYTVEEVSIVNNKQGNQLGGSLVLPPNFKKSSPIVVFITGSGAQNRDEALFGHQPFAVIADYLAQKGIASLRMDDRGVGASEKGKEGATSADFATDISSAVDFLKGKGFKNIGLIGHSEGGMIAPMVAVENNSVKFMVLLAAPGIPIAELMVQQNDAMGRIAGLSDEILKENAKINATSYQKIIQYKGHDLSKDLLPFLEEQLQKSGGSRASGPEVKEKALQQVKVLSSPWFVYFLKFNPSIYLDKIRIPTLALNGSLDLQVAAKSNLQGIRQSLEKAGNSKSEVVELSDLNHLFQTATTGNPTEYGQIEETFSPTALEKIASWILKLKN
jgi:pimeloyl-ACP methyl ester carboxylesterase